MTSYCLVENGAITQGPGPLPASWRNISGLPLLDAGALLSLGWRPFTQDEIPAGKVASASSYEILGDRVVRHWTLNDAPPPPPPSAQQSQPVVGGFTVTSSVVAINPTSLGIASVMRVSSGRYRVYFDPPQPDDKYNLPQISIRDSSNRQCRVTAKLVTYAEIRTFDQTWVAADTQEIGLILNRVSWT